MTYFVRSVLSTIFIFNMPILLSDILNLPENKTSKDIHVLTPQLVKVAQKVYDSWDQSDMENDELIEWEHYVPIKNDFSDLNEKIEWCINNDDKCKKISENANNFVVNKLNLKYVNNKIIKKVINFINF